MRAPERAKPGGGLGPDGVSMLQPLNRGAACGVAMIALVAGIAAPGVARADDAASAATLLDAGKRLMAGGHAAEACPKLAESQKLAPSIGTMMALADCNLALGKTATAWRQYGEAADAAARSNDPREAALRKKVAGLAPRVGRIIVVPPQGAKPSLGLDCDGVPIGVSEWRTELPMDPGSHRVTASTLVGSTWSVKVVVPPDGGVQTVKIPDEVIGQGDPSERAARPTSQDREDDERPLEPESGDPGATRRTLGLVLGGVGVLGVGLGAFFGLRAKSKLDDSNNGHCHLNDRCDATGVALRDDYLGAARISTVSFLAGGVLLAGGALLYFTAPSAPVSIAAAGGPGSANVIVRSTF